MNADDKKFIEVFIIPNDGVDDIPLSAENYDYIFSNLDEELFIKWKNFLSDKYDRYNDDDAYDEWYNNMTFDELSKKDLFSFKLPEDQITVVIPPQVSLINQVIGVIREFYDDLSSYASKCPSYYFGYFIETEPAYLNMYVARVGKCKRTVKGKALERVKDENGNFIKDENGNFVKQEVIKDIDIYSIMKKAHQNYENKIKSIMAKFNDKYGKSGGVSVKSNGISINSTTRKDDNAPQEDQDEKANYRNMYKEKGINNFRYMDISLDSFFRTNKDKDSESSISDKFIHNYVNNIFKNLEPEQKHNHKDISVLDSIW